METRNIGLMVAVLTLFSTRISGAEPCDRTNTSCRSLAEVDSLLAKQENLRNYDREWIGLCPTVDTNGYCSMYLKEIVFSGEPTNEYEMIIFPKDALGIFGEQTKYLSKWTCSWVTASAEPKLSCESKGKEYPVQAPLEICLDRKGVGTLEMSPVGKEPQRFYQVPRPGYIANAAVPGTRSQSLKDAHKKCLAYLDSYSIEARSHDIFKGRQLACTNDIADCKHIKGRFAYGKYYEPAEWSCRSSVVLR